MPRIPHQVSALLEDLSTNLPLILGRNLVGIYLYGSLTQRSFNPERSDIDCLVVTRATLTPVQFKSLRTQLARMAKSNPWTKRLQMQFLLRHHVLTMDAKACLYQFGVLKRSGSDGSPIIWMNALKTGRILFGPPPKSFVPPITRDILLEALERELGYLREEISEKPDSEWRDVPKYRAYAVLTVCRILYSSSKGTIVSKPVAARWALRNLPKEWHRIIRQAVAGNARIDLRPIRQFLSYADRMLHGSAHRNRR